MKITLFHGTEKNFIDPIFGFGNKNNDYGLGFYLTPNYILAAEWACQYVHESNVNEYELDLNGLKILDLTKGRKTILNWIAILLHHRKLTHSFMYEYETELEFLERYYIDVSKYDVVKGYRADDSYFAFPKAFLAENLTIEMLEKIFMLGDLGLQYALISEKAFKQLDYVGTTTCQCHQEFIKRKDEAISLFIKYEKEDRFSKGTRLRDLINND